MRSLTKSLVSFLKREDGPTAVEYAVMLAVILVLVIGTVRLIGGNANVWHYSPLKQINATYYKINRGGDITYHGPGQIVGYPIIDLEKFGLGVREYIEKLEESIIQSLKEYNITSARLEGATGVWLDVQTPKARKICAIGVRMSRYVTMHGFALNINTDLNYFSYINPCGFQDKGVTSIEKELGVKQNFEASKQVVKEKIANVFGMTSSD